MGEAPKAELFKGGGAARPREGPTEAPVVPLAASPVLAPMLAIGGRGGGVSWRTAAGPE